MRSTAIISTASSSSLTQAQLQKLNYTSSCLYRILLRECRYFIQSSTEHENDTKESTKTIFFQRNDGQKDLQSKKGNILLQQPLDPRDWGRARLMYTDDMDIAHTPKSTMILEFFEHFRQSLNGFTSISSISSRRRSPSTSTALERDKSVRVSIYDVIDTIQSSFRQKIPNMTMDQILYHHRRAIDANRILSIQFSMSKKTIETIDETNGVRVTATSRYVTFYFMYIFSHPFVIEYLSTTSCTFNRLYFVIINSCIGKASKSPIAAQKGEINNRFAYRIRVENTGIPIDEEDNENDSNESRPVQLLGRHWSIEENGENAAEPIIVEAPTTGAGKYT